MPPSRIPFSNPLRPTSFVCRTCRSQLPLTSQQALLQPAKPHEQIRLVRTIQKRGPTYSPHNPVDPVFGASQQAAANRKRIANTLHPRAGALAVKKGMTGHFDPETGVRTPCTVLQLERVQVIGHKKSEAAGYDAVIVGEGWRSTRRLPKATAGLFARAQHPWSVAGGPNDGMVGVSAKRSIREFMVDTLDTGGGQEALTPIGSLIKPSWFSLGQFVDVQGMTHGKGFAGVMKRHGFHGQDRSHGVSLTHRAPGSSGGGQGSGSRVHPGKKGPGRMGHNLHTVQNLKVLTVDDENGILVVHGCVPGPKKTVVRVTDAKKKPWPVFPNQVAAAQAEAAAAEAAQTAAEGEASTDKATH